MKRKFSIALMVLFCFIAAHKSNAQYVTIPDANFAAYLSQNFASCMNGRELDTLCAAASSVTKINVSELSIADLTGITYFKNLDTLECYLNNLTSLPTLPASLIYLDCWSNQLSSLPTLPASLTGLSCFSNQLTSLPALPASLVNLFCTNNSLTNLPTLPALLNSLDCSNNQISSLPGLPEFLTTLFCYNNSLSSLPSLPASLTTRLDCSNNQLGSLPALPSALVRLDCDHNTLSNIPTLPDSLTIFECNNNNLYCLPTLPERLTALYAIGNHIACIPNIPSFLIYMDSTFQICTDTSNPNGCTILSVTGNTSAASVQTIEVFPNPSTGIVTINCPFTATGITIAGMDGKTVYQISAGTTNYTIDLSGIAKGLYVAQVSSANGVVTQKVVIQ